MCYLITLKQRRTKQEYSHAGRASRILTTNRISADAGHVYSWAQKRLITANTELYLGRFNSLALISFYLAFECEVSVPVQSWINVVCCRLPDGWMRHPLVPSSFLPSSPGDLRVLLKGAKQWHISEVLCSPGRIKCVLLCFKTHLSTSIRERRMWTCSGVLFFSYHFLGNEVN